jgi:hypothetical protein
MSAAETRADRLRDGIVQTKLMLDQTKAEAVMLRKIGNDLLIQANKLDETVDYQAQQIAEWEQMLVEEEAKS